MYSRDAKLCTRGHHHRHLLFGLFLQVILAARAGRVDALLPKPNLSFS